MPDQTGIEGLQRSVPMWHVLETAQPYETIRILQVAESTEYMCTNSFLRFDEFAFEEADQLLAAAPAQSILTQYNDRDLRRGAEQGNGGDDARRDCGQRQGQEAAAIPAWSEQETLSLFLIHQTLAMESQDG